MSELLLPTNTRQRPRVMMSLVLVGKLLLKMSFLYTSQMLACGSTDVLKNLNVRHGRCGVTRYQAADPFTRSWELTVSTRA